MNRRGFFKSTAGALAVAAYAPFIKAAPEVTRLVGIRERTIQGYEYISIAAGESIAQGDMVAIGPDYTAFRLENDHRGPVGVAMAPVVTGATGWALIYGKATVAAVNYPYVVNGELHGASA